MKHVLSAVLTLLFVAGCSGGKPEAAPGTAAAPAPIQKGDLVKAVAVDNYEQALSLLDAGADANENIGTGVKEITPLLTAVAYGRERLVLLLLERGAATHPAFNRYTANDFALKTFGDDGKVRRMLLQRSLRKTSPATGGQP